MKKSEIFEKVLSVVSDYTEISRQQILSKGRTNEEVDARSIAIYYWKKHGLTSAFLMEKMQRKSRSAIQYLYNLHDDRCRSNRYYQYQSSIIGQELSKIFTISMQ